MQTQFTSRPAARRVQRPGVTCSALPKDLAKVAGCAALSLALLGANVDAAQADVAGAWGWRWPQIMAPLWVTWGGAARQLCLGGWRCGQLAARLDREQSCRC